MIRFTGFCLLAAAGISQAALPEQFSIDQWTVPWENSRPRDPYTADGQTIWFVGQRSDYAARFDVNKESFNKVDLPPGAGPHNVIVSSAGVPWYAGNRAAHIGRIDPESGDITRFDMPDPEATRDPHTLVFDADENIWFTVQGGNQIGHLDTRTGAVRTIDIATARARPYGIKLDPNGRPWIVLLGTHKLATVNPADMALREIDLPRKDARPRRMEIDDQGHIWYVDYAGGYLGRFDPKTSEFEEWMLPGGADAKPYGTAMDSDGYLVIAETGGDQVYLVGFDPVSEAFFARTPVPGGGGSIRHMSYHPGSDTVWFGTDDNTLGRVRIAP